MRFRRLNLTCQCGQTATRFHAVGFTSQYELVVHWVCCKCRKHAYLVKPFSDCCKQCPDPGDTNVSPLTETGFDAHAEDARFLQSLGIRP
jgi:hypothetical protein